MSLSIDRFAPTPAAKLGLGLDLSVLTLAVVLSTTGPWWLRAAWILCAMGVFWSTSAVARHHGSYVVRTRWDDVLLTAMLLFSVVTVVAVGGRIVGVPYPHVGRLLLIAFPVQVLLRVTVFSFVRARTMEPRRVLIVGTGPLGRITGEIWAVAAWSATT